MKKLLFLFLLVPMSSSHALDTAHVLTAEQWAVPRSVETILQMPALVGAMEELQATPGARLLIRYPGGDAGSLWMNELHSWLVSLGVPSRSMDRVPGSASERTIELEIMPPGSSSSSLGPVAMEPGQ
jgi:hypothetical protein